MLGCTRGESGHGGVASLTSDISCVHNASAESVRVTLRRISGSRALGAFALSVEEVCPGCGLLHSDHEEALERHIYTVVPAPGRCEVLHAPGAGVCGGQDPQAGGACQDGGHCV